MGMHGSLRYGLEPDSGFWERMAKELGMLFICGL